jgi:MFS transporter, DHA1 family, multidrug resistance protein
MSVAPLLAPILGGYLLLIGWRAIFASLAAIGLAVLAATWAGLGESVKRRDPHATRARELTRNLFDFLRRPACIGHALLVCFVFCGLFAYISSSSFVFIEVFGIPSDRFGYLFGLSAFALMTGAGINSRLAHRVRPGAILRFGVGLVVAGSGVMIACAALRVGGVAGIIGPILVYVLGMSMVTPHAIAAAMEPVPHMAGFASSLIGALQTAGGALVAYMIGALYNRTALPLALGVGISGALAGVTYFMFLSRLAAAAPPGRPPSQENGNVDGQDRDRDRLDERHRARHRDGAGQGRR